MSPAGQLARGSKVPAARYFWSTLALHVRSGPGAGTNTRVLSAARGDGHAHVCATRCLSHLFTHTTGIETNHPESKHSSLAFPVLLSMMVTLAFIARKVSLLMSFESRSFELQCFC